jgi:hypothetical protein
LIQGCGSAAVGTAAAVTGLAVDGLALDEAGFAVVAGFAAGVWATEVVANAATERRRTIRFIERKVSG